VIICCEGDGAAFPGTMLQRIHRRCPE